MMPGIRVGMWNCSGLLPSSFASEKMSFIGTLADFDVLILIETHHKDLKDISPLLRSYDLTHEVLHTEAPTDDPYAGILVLVSKAYSLLNPSVLLPGRLLNFSLENGMERHNLSVLYGYTGSQATPANMGRISELLKNYHRPTDNNLILGDLNFVDNDLDRVNQYRTGMNQRDRGLAKIWLQLTDELGLSDAFRLRNPKRKMFSYIHTQNGAKSRIDRVYANDENCSRIFHYKHTPNRWQKAHRLVSFSLEDNVNRGPGFWKLNTSVLSDRAYLLMVESTLKDVLDLNINDAIERWLIFIETIRLESQVYCQRKRYFERELKNLCEVNIELLERNSRFHSCVKLQTMHDYYTNTLQDWTKKQIEGHQIRIKTQPKFEQCEPKIDFYAGLEKKVSKKKVISHLIDDKGTIVQERDKMEAVAINFYSDLFSPKNTDQGRAACLLSNVKTKVPQVDLESLNRAITKEELGQAVMRLQRNKSPGPDGIPAEFYQQCWGHIGDLYFAFVSAVENSVFPESKNTSVTSLIFKNKGNIGLLAYYRPIALMNVDVKILTKMLSMRLVPVLPKIIHKSQTSVFGRAIGDNVNLVRDLIDLANKNDEDAAFLFLDQEKAFDRVNHDFLYKVLQQFGLGSFFIHWVKLLYSNASTRVNLNGFLTCRIPLRCGVRQGCPLSALLYVLVIEILALQLRANPNIVGFTIKNEKIVSSHYADDTVIKITQNRCFKEVYKELRHYESASGAKVNYEKTQGLWCGRWRGRTDDPFAGLYQDGSYIKWTSGNVKHLGVYVGNEDPCTQTFKEIIPKVQRRLNFWKPLQLPKLAKARVVEIFHASKLFYAANFYPIPKDMLRDLDHAFLDYINFPSSKPMVSKMEMEKLREFGGLKLINIQLKAETPKIKWLMRLITDEGLTAHKQIFESLMASEGLYLSGSEAIFAETSFIKKCKISNLFYGEALEGISKLNTFKQFSDINNEHVFFNRIFVTSTDDEVHDRTLTPFRGNKVLGGIRTYGDLLQAEDTITNPRWQAAVRKKIDSIEHIRENVDAHLVIGLYGQKEFPFHSISQKDIYSELVHSQSKVHPFEGKWADKNRLGITMDWDQIWASVHNQFLTEKTKSSIWEQLHLNFYTTYNFNRWFNQLNPCPLCRKIPDDVFHIIMDCKFTKVLWRKLQNTLMLIIPIPLSDHEMAFGLSETNKDRYAIRLRNWATYTLRHLIALEERKTYKINIESKVKATPSFEKFFAKLNYYAAQELREKKLIYDFQGLSEKFENIVTVNEAVASLVNGDYVWKDLV